MGKKKKSKKPVTGTGPGTNPNYIQPEDSRDLSALLAYGPSYIPYTSAWTSARIEQVNAFKRWVFVAIDVIAGKFAEKSPNVSKITGSVPVGKDHKAKHFLREKALIPLLSHQALTPLPYNHPLPRLLADPNHPDTAWTFWYETVMFLLLTGNCYWWLPRPTPGLPPAAIWVLPPHWVWPVIGKDRLIDGWELRPIEGNYLRQTLPVEEVVHFRKPNPISKIDGYSPLNATGQWADVSESIDRSRVQSFQNGIFPTVAIKFDGSLNDPSDEMLKRIEAKVLARTTGPHRANKPLFVPPGADVVPLSLMPNQMVWGENALETRNNILAGYKVPPICAGLMENIKDGREIAAAMELLCEAALNPLGSFIGQTISEKVCPMFDESGQTRVWWEAFMANSAEHRETQIKTDMMIGALTVNELRVMRGREPYPWPWADEPMMPVNMQPATTPFGGSHQDPKDKPPKVPLPDMPNISSSGD